MIQQELLGPFKILLNSANARLFIDVWGWELARVYSVKLENVTWATAVFNIKHSVNKVDLHALDTAQTLGVGSDWSTAIDVTTIKYLALDSNTVEGSGAGEGDVYCIVERDITRS